MAEYLFKKGLKYDQVAKFEDSKDPTAVYLFTARGCSCPARTRSCKHTKLLKLWKQNGEIPGEVYDDSGNILAHLF
jgi:hypothetical protein